MYRILTEDKNRERIYRILNSYVTGFTVTEAIGSYKGMIEKSLAIDIAGYPGAVVERIAEAIKQWNQQESVLVLEIPTTEHFI